MPSTESFKDFIEEQMGDAGTIASRRMFGAYCLYCDGKPVAFICDDQLLVKPTEKGREFIGEVTGTELFPGSKQWFIVEDRYEDREWLSQLIRITAEELPPPKPKKKKAGNPKKYLIG